MLRSRLNPASIKPSKGLCTRASLAGSFWTCPAARVNGSSRPARLAASTLPKEQRWLLELLAQLEQPPFGAVGATAETLEEAEQSLPELAEKAIGRAIGSLWAVG
jgi:hypothetical protein